MAKIGFIGLGNMGLPMAGNLVKAGHAVVGFDLVGENLQRATARGVTDGQSAGAAAADVDVVVTMLPAGRRDPSSPRQPLRWKSLTRMT